MPARILVVEDDPVLSDLLSSVLGSKGYRVDVTDDGVKAVQLLKGGGYDLALMDYQMPEIDGFATARLLREGTTGGGSAPKLIAVTGSAELLEQRAAGLSLFDAIVQKPFDVEKLMELVASALDDPTRRQAAEASRAAWRRRGLSDLPRAVVVPPPSAERQALLGMYFDVEERAQTDAIVLAEPSGLPALQLVRGRSDGYLLPVIDVTGRMGEVADAVFSASDDRAWDDVAAKVTRFADRRRLLAPSIVFAQDADTRLLAYLFVSGRSFEPKRDPEDRSCVQYPGFFPTEFRSAADRLFHRGLLQRRFADRFHACRSCASHRLNVREECPSCRSADLSEVAIIHHFRCAFTAPETEFQSGRHLACPKCRQQLRHYGSDYDKPGHALVCGACGAKNSEPAIGFTCLDCGMHTDGDAADRKDVYAYDITDEAVTLLTAPAPPLSVAGPVHGVQRLAHASSSERRGSTTIELRYGARERIAAKRGLEAFQALRRLFVESMRGALTVDESIVSEGDVDKLLLHVDDRRDLHGFLADLLGRAGKLLAEDLEPTSRVVDPVIEARAS